jgi:hypothetical protein
MMQKYGKISSSGSNGDRSLKPLLNQHSLHEKECGVVSDSGLLEPNINPQQSFDPYHNIGGGGGGSQLFNASIFHQSQSAMTKRLKEIIPHYLNEDQDNGGSIDNIGTPTVPVLSHNLGKNQQC